MDSIAKILDGVKVLLPAPQILPPLLQAIGEEEPDLNRMVDLISLDPALTIKLLRLCNSAYFGLATKIDSVAEAVRQLGFQSVYRTVAAEIGGRMYTASQTGAGDLQADWWRRAVLSAFAAQFVAADIEAEPGTMFTAGLLHELGRVVLLQAFNVDYARLLQEPGLSEAEVAEREMRAFGTTHAEVGGRLLARWQFDTPIISGVRFHTDPTKAGEASARRFGACVHLGNELALSVATAKVGQNLAPIEPPISMAMLNRSPEDLSRYQGLLIENMRFVEGLCRLN